MKEVEYNLLRDTLHLRTSAGTQVSPDEISLILRSVDLNNIEVIENVDRRVVGYIIFGNIDKYSLFWIMRNRAHPKYSYEYNEGNITLLLSIFIDPNYRNDGIAAVRKFILQKKAVVYLRNNNVKVFIRQKGKFFKKVTSNIRFGN